MKKIPNYWRKKSYTCKKNDMKLIIKLTQREIDKGYISISKDLLGNFYPLYSKLDIENAEDQKISINQTFNNIEFDTTPFIKRLVLRIKDGSIVVELILNNILQRLNLHNEDLLVIDKIAENDFNLSYIKANELEQYHHHINLLNGLKYYISIN